MLYGIRIVFLQLDSGEISFLIRDALAEVVKLGLTANAYNKLTVDSASHLEVLIGGTEDTPVDMDFAVIAECDGQIRVVRIVIPAKGH
jgi:hypothetical protein